MSAPHDHAGEQTEQQPALPLRPRLADNAAVHPPRAEGGQWLIERPGPKYFRVSKDVASLALLLTGERDHDELLAELDEKWDADALQTALRQFQKLRILDDGLTTRPSTRRLTVAPPLTVQLSLLDPTSLLRRMLPLIELFSRPLAVALIGVLSGAGLVVLGWRAGEVRQVLSQPVDGSAFLFFLLIVFVSTAIHELAHAALLVRYGARPRRMGVMLFYLVPAFFCDVSDGWLLPRNGQRVRVALAGIVAQAACAGAVALVALVAGEGARELLLLTSASLYLAAVINLVPFVKLDGYLALMAWLDIPNLRSRACDDARDFLASVTFGSRRRRQLPSVRWAVPYGLCCLLFPIYLVAVVAFGMWSRLLSGTGYVGAMIALSIASIVLTIAVRGMSRVVKHALAAGASPVRVGGVLVAGCLLLGTVLTQVQVAERIPGHYQVDGDQVLLVLADGSTADRVEADQVVELRSNGLVLQPTLGRAVVGSESPDRLSQSAFTFLPVTLDIDLPMDFRVFTLNGAVEPDQPVGSARVLVGEAPLWSWIYQRYVAFAV